MMPFRGCCSTVSRLQSHYEMFTFYHSVTRSSGIHLIDLEIMKGSVELGATQQFSTWDPWTENPAPCRQWLLRLAKQNLATNSRQSNFNLNMIQSVQINICYKEIKMSFSQTYWNYWHKTYQDPSFYISQIFSSLN